jgi:uncharacterized protein YggU (UPF0235/DUF167 family)
MGVARPDATVAVRVRPRSARAGVGGRYAGVNGPALIVSVLEPAVDGRATQAVLRAVAEALGLPRSRVRLRTGERSRDKLLTIVDPPPDLAARLTTLLGEPADDGGTRA